MGFVFSPDSRAGRAVGVKVRLKCTWSGLETDKYTYSLADIKIYHPVVIELGTTWDVANCGPADDQEFDGRTSDFLDDIPLIPYVFVNSTRDYARLGVLYVLRAAFSRSAYTEARQICKDRKADYYWIPLRRDVQPRLSLTSSIGKLGWIQRKERTKVAWSFGAIIDHRVLISRPSTTGKFVVFVD